MGVETRERKPSPFQASGLPLLADHPSPEKGFKKRAGQTNQEGRRAVRPCHLHEEGPKGGKSYVVSGRH